MIRDIYYQDGFRFMRIYDKKLLSINSDKIQNSLSYAETNKIAHLEINYTQGYNLNNIDFVKDYPFIQGLHIVKDVNGMDIDAVHALSNLQYLYINRAPEQTLDFDAFPKLVTLNFEWDKHVKNLSSGTSLKELTIRKYKKEDLSELQPLKELQQLSIVQSSISSLKGIDNLIGLESLELYLLTKLASLKGIENLTNLSKLTITTCSKIRNIDPVMKLEKLRSLEINNCKDIGIRPSNYMFDLFLKFWG